MGSNDSHISYITAATILERKENSPKMLSMRATPTFILGGGHGRFITARTCISN